MRGRWERFPIRAEEGEKRKGGGDDDEMEEDKTEILHPRRTRRTFVFFNLPLEPNRSVLLLNASLVLAGVCVVFVWRFVPEHYHTFVYSSSTAPAKHLCVNDLEPPRPASVSLVFCFFSPFFHSSFSHPLRAPLFTPPSFLPGPPSDESRSSSYAPSPSSRPSVYGGDPSPSVPVPQTTTCFLVFLCVCVRNLLFAADICESL